MKFDDFVNALYEAGWLSTNDAQHAQIKELHRKLFPVIAELEQEVFELGLIKYETEGFNIGGEG